MLGTVLNAFYASSHGNSMNHKLFPLVEEVEKCSLHEYKVYNVGSWWEDGI